MMTSIEIELRDRQDDVSREDVIKDGAFTLIRRLRGGKEQWKTQGKLIMKLNIIDGGVHLARFTIMK